MIGRYNVGVEMTSKFAPRLKMSKLIIIQIINELKEDNSAEDSS